MNSTRGAKRPLDGIRILDLTRHLAGAGATRTLALFGAEIIRIEWPHLPALDFLRLSKPYAGSEPGLNRGGIFGQINVDKQSVGIDLSTPGGQAILRALVPHCDVVIESFTPGVMQKWGLNYAGLRALRDDIIYVAASGFGHTGPHRDYRSVGPTAQAYSGLTAIVGLPGREPAGWGFSYMDHMGAAMNAASVLMALERRRATGQGEFIDGGQTQHGCALLGPILLDASINHARVTPDGNHDHYRNYCPHNAYRCAGTDAWVAIAVRDTADWLALCDEIGAADLARDPALRTLDGRLARQDEIDARISGWTAGRDRYDVQAKLQGAGIPAGAVQHVDDKVLRDPQLAFDAFYEQVDDPILGRHRYEGMPVSAAFPTTIQHARPLLGEHTRAVLGRLLDYSDSRLDELASGGVIFQDETYLQGAAK